MGTMLSWVALVVALAAIAYAWKLQQELQTATSRLDRYNRALFAASDEIRQVRAEAVASLARLRAEIPLSRHAKALFVPEMTVREAMALHPQAEQILAAFHLGGCSSCAVAADDTLGSVCRNHGRDLEQLLQNLNLLVAAAQNGQNEREQRVKVPNVEVSF